MKKETLARKVKATVESGIRQRKKVVLFEHLILMVHSVKLCLGVSYMKLSAASLNLSEFKLGGSVGKESACNAVDLLKCRRPRFDPWVGNIPWRRKWQPTPVFLSGKSHGQRSLAGYSLWGRKESDRT